MLLGRWIALVVMVQFGLGQAAQASQAAPAAAAARAPEYVVAIPGSKEYHWPGCPLVRKTTAPAVMLRSQAEGKGLKPHKDCDPANAPADGGTGTDAAKPEFVYVQANDNKYHRTGCKLLGKEARRVPLDKDAVRGRWPCTVCRPPIRTPPKALP
jgi:transcription elongation factor